MDRTTKNACWSGVGIAKILLEKRLYFSNTLNNIKKARHHHAARDTH